MSFKNGLREILDDQNIFIELNYDELKYFKEFHINILIYTQKKK